MENKTEGYNLMKTTDFNVVNDGRMRKFQCWGSVEVVDRHNEILPIDEVVSIMDTWMDRDAPIQYNHTSRGVGKGLNWQLSEKNGKPGVLITGKIFDNYKEDEEVWKGIKTGAFEGLSIGGKNYTREKTSEGTILKDIIGYEFSLVESCGNQEATFENINMLAKSNDKMEAESITKQDELIVEGTQEVSEDNLKELMSQMSILIERVAALEEMNSGKPTEEAPIEEIIEEVEKQTEVESVEEEVVEEVEKAEVEAEVEEQADSVSEEDINTEAEVEEPNAEEVENELKKNAAQVVETSRPTQVAKSQTTRKAEIMANIAKTGAIDYSALRGL